MSNNDSSTFLASSALNIFPTLYVDIKEGLNPDLVSSGLPKSQLYTILSIFSAWCSTVDVNISITALNWLIKYFVNSITPDMFNDIKIIKGIFWGKVYIDTVKEFVCLSNISSKALSEIETNIFTNMNKEKRQGAFRVKE